MRRVVLARPLITEFCNLQCKRDRQALSHPLVTIRCRHDSHGVAGAQDVMAWMMFLDIALAPKSCEFDRHLRRGLTVSKRGAHIADIMLFDRSSLVDAQDDGKTYRILLSERIRAVERFRRRLPRVLDALNWHPVATDTLPRFGKFFERIDWPYVLLETGEYRMNFWDPEYYMTSEEFDWMLEFAVSAIDDPAMAIPGNAFGGGGRYSPAWEKLLEFCFFRPERIYAGDEKARRAWPWGGPSIASRSSSLLKSYLFRSPTLSRGPYNELVMMTTSRSRDRKIGVTSAVGQQRLL
jgi:hypothetical protein